MALEMWTQADAPGARFPKRAGQDLGSHRSVMAHVPGPV